MQKTIYISLTVGLLVLATLNRDNPASTSQLTTPHSDYQTEMAQLEATILELATLVQEQQNSWTVCERLASAWMQRARLSGDLHDYKHAEDTLALAFRRAGPGAGPFMMRARLNFTLHRLERVERDLSQAEAAVLINRRQRASIDGLRANLDFQQGLMETARQQFLLALEQHESFEGLARLALYHWQAGEFARAEQLYLRGSELLHGSPRLRAWTHLQLGLMDLDRGRTHAALAHYEDAESHFGGWWLIEEHMAEIDALHGETYAAIAQYQDLVDRTGNPEFMDALAALTAGAIRQDWITRAAHSHRLRMQLFHQAALGHSLDHFLEFGSDVQETLRFAEANFSLRPNATASIALARAHLSAGSPEDARAVLHPVLSTPVRSAELFATAAAVEVALGQNRAADTFLHRARAINPGSNVPAVALREQETSERAF